MSKKVKKAIAKDVRKVEYEELPLSDYPPTFEFLNIGDVIEGRLVDMRHEVGTNKQSVATIETENGKFSVWISKGLSRMVDLYDTIKGKVVRIQYTADVQVKRRKKPMKIFSLALKK